MLLSMQLFVVGNHASAHKSAYTDVLEKLKQVEIELHESSSYNVLPVANPEGSRTKGSKKRLRSAVEVFVEKQKKPKKSKRCKACGELGHNRNNKRCKAFKSKSSPRAFPVKNVLCVLQALIV